MIKISDDIFIDADINNYILKKKVQRKKDDQVKEVFEVLGFYSSIEQLLLGLIKKELRKFISKKEEIDVQSLIREIRKLERKVKEFNVGNI